MTSAAQVLANRSNAEKSTGPRTPQGKATASQNAVKHGLLAEQVVIKGEDPAQFECYREGMLQELAPVSGVEAMLAERVVSLAWRLRRAERLQSAVFATVYRENADDIVLWPRHGLPIQPGPGEDEVVLGQVVMTDFARAKVLDRLLVYERRIESSLYRTMAELRRERQARVAAREPEEISRSEGNLAAGHESAAPVELGSFDLGATPKRSLSVSAPAQESPPSGHGQTSLSVPPTRVDRFSHTLSHSEDNLARGQGFGALVELGSFGLGATPKRSLSVSSPAQESPPSRHGQTSLSMPPTCVDRFSYALSRSEDNLADGLEPVAPAELASFGADAAEEAASARREASNATCQALSEGSDFALQTSHLQLAKITPDGVTTNSVTGGNHGRDARATKTLPASPFTLHEQSCETNPTWPDAQRPNGLG